MIASISFEAAIDFPQRRPQTETVNLEDLSGK
jgi:hypothetical protein